ncbi:MAG: type II toxin-antitoxin system VapC family toxin [Alphaproteobacteria bacterium]|nr:type II toxin-antitoxin system VapC family toxin [Alphaproteobacteria bacterium]
MPFVVDASAALAWCFADEATAATGNLLASLQKDYAAAPALWLSEVANALHTASRRGRLSIQDVDDHLLDLSALPLILDTPPDAVAMGITVALARAHQLTIYDASYLELALRHSLPLASLDTDLRKGARAEGVKLLL